MSDSTANPRRPRRRLYASAAATLACAGALAFGIPTAANAAPAQTVASAYPGWSNGYGSNGYSSNGYGSNGYGSGGYGSSSYGSPSSVADATPANADESTGLVLIDTVLGYQDAAAAGTGMVLTSNGLVLTNNHVVAGSTQIRVTIASTGETYTAKVVGTDAQDDVALLQLQGASGLATVTIDQDAETIGQAVTAVGNAKGGGVLLAADGQIIDLDTTVTTAAEGSAPGETLDGMIQISADVVSGDSGGALLDAQGEVVGMTTAASTGTANTTAWAIPIEDALAIAKQIVNGDESDGVTIGYPAFLGVGLAQQSTSPARSRYGTSTSATGALIAGVYQGTPADEAGLTGGDTITAVDGTAVTDASTLSSLLSARNPGDTVTLTWVDASGSTRSAAVTLVAGPVA
ncbi:trypsin-like peptidase domain-containing protein [Microbacterium sp. AZCO]|uniref:S1C family serine protease n=1 Tax=Microbacterium sp. AZCO TaxID=3142976 RepID=UPI0031F3A19E